MKIALLGDVALFGSNTVENTKYKDKFNLLRDCLYRFDYVIANLETPLTNSLKTVGGKSAYIKGKPENIEILNYVGITHVTLANNHIYDFRCSGVDDTIEVLNEAGIEWFGLRGKTIDITNCDSKVKLHGYCCYSTNGKGLGTVIDVLNPVQIEKDIEKDMSEGFLPLLAFHWGQEHVHYPNYDHIQVARKLAEKGKVIIYGHHPHVLQGIERINKSLIAYSTGNFCFDDVYTNKSNEPLIKLQNDNRDMIILGLEIEHNEIIRYSIEGFSFDDTQYIENPEIKEQINVWSAFLNENEYSFKKKRQNDLNCYLMDRRKKRDWNWYYKRMNIESIKIILSNMKNKKLYDSLFHNYVKK